jgi:hypothetical protein
VNSKRNCLRNEEERQVSAKGEEKAFFADPDLRGLAFLRNEAIRRSLQKRTQRFVRARYACGVGAG